jgi:hypothetical protein
MAEGDEGEELDLAALRPDFRSWLFQAADENFDRSEAAHGDQAATIALIAELMQATVVYGAWEAPDSEGGFRVVVIKGRDILSKRDSKNVLCSVQPGIPLISPHIFGFGNRWNSHGISVG